MSRKGLQKTSKSISNKKSKMDHNSKKSKKNCQKISNRSKKVEKGVGKRVKTKVGSGPIDVFDFLKLSDLTVF